MSFSKLSSLLGDKSPNGDQPRLPKGDPHGGRWTRMDVFAGEKEEGDTDSDSLLYVGEPIRLAQATKGDGNSLVLPGQALFSPLVLEPATRAFRWHVERAKDGELPVFEFKAREYRREEGKTLDLSGVRTLERDDAQRRCPKTSDIQKLINESMNDVLKKLGVDRQVTPQVLGTFVHGRLEEKVTNLRNKIEKEFADDLKKRVDNPSPKDVPHVRDLEVTIEEFGSEQSYRENGKDARRNERGSVRADVSYKAGRTACGVDLKTGNRGLDGPRAAKLATRLMQRYGDKIDEVIIMEMRPFER